jgi:hypothetical protein
MASGICERPQLIIDRDDAYYRHEFIAPQGCVFVQYFYSCCRISIFVLAGVHVASQEKRSGGAKPAGYGGYLNGSVEGDQPPVSLLSLYQMKVYMWYLCTP